jgi:predicted LPLAT superfamily acyltransferase
MAIGNDMKAQWHGHREHGNSTALWLMRTISLILGRPLAIWLMWPVSLYFCIYAPIARRSSSDFLHRALGRQPTPFEIWRHFYTFAVSLLDRIYLAAGRLRSLHIEIEGESTLRAALKSGSGCVLVGSHLGNFDAVRACGLPLNASLKILMHLEQSPVMMSVLYGDNPAWRETFIPLGKADSFLRAYRELENGTLVAMLGDRAYRQERSLALTFLGAPALFPTGPMLLAVITGRPVVLFYGLYQGKGSYRICFEHLSVRDEFAQTDRDIAIKSLLSRYCTSLETQARRAPFNWYNFYDFWHDVNS